MKEHTSVGLSGIHFRHIKVYSISTDLLSFKATIRHIPYVTGYAPKDWCTSINTIIEKKGKENLVSDLHTINLMEADFNFNNKVMVKAIIHYVEQNHLLLMEQYGSHKGYRVID